MIHTLVLLVRQSRIGESVRQNMHQSTPHENHPPSLMTFVQEHMTVVVDLGRADARMRERRLVRALLEALSPTSGGLYNLAHLPRLVTT